jgi:hypothetical protein
MALVEALNPQHHSKIIISRLTYMGLLLLVSEDAVTTFLSAGIMMVFLAIHASFTTCVSADIQ